MGNLREKVYCAFCRIPHFVYRKKHIGWTNIWLSFASAVLLMFIFWQKIDPRAIIFFVLGICVSECFIQIRRRLSLRCSSCGFDPVIYLKDHRAACENVKVRLETAKESPELLFSANNPLTHLPRKSRSLEKVESTDLPPAP